MTSVSISGEVQSRIIVKTGAYLRCITVQGAKYFFQRSTQLAIPRATLSTCATRRRFMESLLTLWHGTRFEECRTGENQETGENTKG